MLFAEVGDAIVRNASSSSSSSYISIFVSLLSSCRLLCSFWSMFLFTNICYLFIFFSFSIFNWIFISTYGIYWIFCSTIFSNVENWIAYFCFSICFIWSDTKVFAISLTSVNFIFNILSLKILGCLVALCMISLWIWLTNILMSWSY